MKPLNKKIVTGVGKKYGKRSELLMAKDVGSHVNFFKEDLRDFGNKKITFAQLMQKYQDTFGNFALVENSEVKGEKQ